MTRRTFDLSVYLVTDPILGGTRPVADIVAQAAAGGATLVQLRDPFAKTRALVELARALKGVLETYRIPLVINDRIDVVLAMDADGVHVGQADMAAADARRLIGPDRILGVSVANAAELAAVGAGLAEVDYIGTGPVFTTSTKPDAGSAIGVAGIAAMRALTTLPIVAIGGLDAERTREAVRAGADGAAVVSAIMAATDPAAAARAVAQAVAEGRGL